MLMLTEKTGKEILLGGWFLGGGGGGLPEGGQEVLEQVLSVGEVAFLSLEDLAPDDMVVTASLVGSPASKTAFVGNNHYEDVYEQFCRNASQKIAAFAANEAGGHSITNGWMISAITGVPMVDATCNGRAHPTGVMGAMGLHSIPGYTTLQTAAGGKDEREVLLTVSGSVETTSQMVRQAAVQAGGYVTVLRNAASAEYFRQNGAVGCITQARMIGRHWEACIGSMPKLKQMLKDLLDCRVLGEGRIEKLELSISGGFDVGAFQVETEGEPLRVDFMNEYLTAEQGNERLATFPELIAVIDTKTQLPVCSAQLKKGMDVAVVAVPMKNLLLGKGMYLPELFIPLEEAIQKPMRPYLF